MTRRAAKIAGNRRGTCDGAQRLRMARSAHNARKLRLAAPAYILCVYISLRRRTPSRLSNAARMLLCLINLMAAAHLPF